VTGVVDVPEGRSGDWEVRRFEQTEDDAFRSAIKYKNRLIMPGNYTCLMLHREPDYNEGRGYEAYMSDTPAEMHDHEVMLDRTLGGGNVLVMGLGIGAVMELLATQHADDMSKLGMVVFVEKNRDVLDLVSKHYAEKYPRHFIPFCADALTLDPFKLKQYTSVHKWDVIWHDIWPSISTKNKDEYKLLLDRWERFAHWQGAWQQDHVFMSEAEEVQKMLFEEHGMLISLADVEIGLVKFRKEQAEGES